MAMLLIYARREATTFWQPLGSTEGHRRWWLFMKEIMLTNPGNRVVAIELDAVFTTYATHTSCSNRGWRSFA